MKNKLNALKALAATMALVVCMVAAGCSNPSSSPSPIVTPEGGLPSSSGGISYVQKTSGFSNTGESHACYITSVSGGYYMMFFNNNGVKTWEWGTFSAYQSGALNSDSYVGKVAKLKGTWAGDDGYMQATRVLSKTHSHNGSEWVENSVSNWKTIKILLGRFNLSVD